MIIYGLGIAMVIAMASYMYKSYTDYNFENEAKAKPLAEQLAKFLVDYAVQKDETRVRVKRVDVYDDFASMLTIKQATRSWDFNIVNKKIATDPTKCIRLHLAFHCKNEQEAIWVLTPKEGIPEEVLAMKATNPEGFEAEFGNTFLIESNMQANLPTWLDTPIQQRMLDIYKENKGTWRLQKNTITYKEPIEIDTDEKRLAVYKIIDLGFELAKKVDA